MAPKRKKGKEKKFKKCNCIIHFSEIKDEQFITLSMQKLQKVKEIAEKRQSQAKDSPDRYDEVCQNIPDSIGEFDGYHRQCYQKFTRNLKRIRVPSNDVSEEESSTPKAKRVQGDKIKFTKDCIFCNKFGLLNVKKKGLWTTEEIHDFRINEWECILQKAEEKFDEKLLRRIRGYDLYAAGAKYHRTCKFAYLYDEKRWRSSNLDEVSMQRNLEETHGKAFSCVLNIIDEKVIRKMEVIKLTDLRDLYIQELENTEFFNDDYRCEKLKKKIENDVYLSSKVSFVKLENPAKFQTYLLFSNQVELSKAIQHAYSLGERDNNVEVAKKMRAEILKSYQMSENFGWPPDLNYLKKTDVIPEELTTFLTLLVTGKSSQGSSKTNRLVSSIGQDICRAVTNAQWKLPKHISLCLTLRHIFRSKELITLVNRLGHCENYSFSLELETAIATAADLQSSLLSQRIVRNPEGLSVFHSEFDNFDQLVNDLTGKGSVHTAHGLMLQDFSDEQVPQFQNLPVIDKTKIRSWKSQQVEELEDCYLNQRQSPNMQIRRVSLPGNEEAFLEAKVKDIAWILLRETNCDSQSVPGWAGFVSQTGEKPPRLTVLDYYPVIYKPITEYSTVQACLRLAEKATNEVGQFYVFTTFDLGVCMKAYPLVWKYPQLFERHIILIGTFHLTMGYYHMIGKKMEGSGFQDVLLEANLASSLSVNGVLSGKNYNRATFCHKTMLEALHRLLIEEFVKSKESERTLEDIASLNTHKDLKLRPSEENLANFTQDGLVSTFTKNYLEFCESVRNGSLGKTAQFWISYMDHVALVISLRRAVKTNNFELYTSSLTKMPDMFFSFGGQNYARYLTYFVVFLANLEFTHPGAIEQIKQGVFSVARSYIPGNRCAVDKTMEEVFMKHAKSSGGCGGASAGLTGICQNYSAYQRWIKSTPQRVKYLEATYDLAGLNDTSSEDAHHRDVRYTEIKKSERVVEVTMDALNNFVNPFSVSDKNSLYCISSGQKVPFEIEKDILGAEAVGQGAKVQFIETRLKSEEKSFFDPVKRLNLKTFSSMGKKVSVTTKQKKVVELKQQGNIAFQLLVKSQSLNLSLDLQHILSFQLTPVPYCLGTADGFLNKTNKAKGFHFLTKEISDADPPNPQDTFLIIDGNAVIHSLRDVPNTFREICEKIFNMIPSSSYVIFSTDSYNVSSIKAMERERRGTGEKLLVKGPSMRRPADWKNFLTNDENKKKLMLMLMEVWSDDSFATHLLNRKVVLVIEGKAVELSSEDGLSVVRNEILEICSNQEETDSRIALYAAYGARREFRNIKVKSPDSDLFFILLHFALDLDSTLFFDTGVGNNKRLLNITCIAVEYGKKKCAALMGLHSFTGCDTSSAFRGIGKVKPIKVLEKKLTFEDCFGRLGESWSLDSDIITQLEKFTCTLYGYPRYSDINLLRYDLLMKKCDGNMKLDASKSVDLASLPPCSNTLIQHIKRCNFQLGIWRRAMESFQELPDPTDHGWVMVDLVLEPIWCEGGVLPEQLTDLLEEDTVADNDEDENLLDCDLSVDSESDDF